MTIYANENRTLFGTCGVGLFAGFSRFNGSSYNNNNNIQNLRGVGGCGWQVAGFINDTVRKETYEVFKKRFKIVMQSPVRRNNNSDHNFFFVVYDCKKPRKSKKNPNPEKLDLSGNVNYSWPWIRTGTGTF